MNNQEPKKVAREAERYAGTIRRRSSAAIRQNAAGGEYNQNRGNPNTKSNYQSGQPGSQRNAPAGGGEPRFPNPPTYRGYRPVQIGGSGI